jgi:hypothetical protein
MTEAPEDTTYLEEDPLAAEQLDLSGAVIDEPDLSGHITENPVQEPSLENISIDLDLEDLEDTPGDEPSFEIMTEDTEDMEIPLQNEEEIPLQNGEEIPETGGGEDFPADISFEDISESEELKPEEESFAQVIPEGFVVEPDDSQSAPPFDTVDTTEALREEDLDILEGDTGIAEFPPESPAEEKEIKAADEKAADSVEISGIPSSIKNELKTVLSYMDQLLESLPEEKIEEFAKSEYFETYKKLFEELGLV